MTKRLVGLAAAWIALSTLGIAGSVPTPTEMVRLKALFARPTADYSTAPLWVWNDSLTDEMVVSTLRDLAAQHVKQAFVHPRPGLMTPYLSSEWFRLWRVALAEAERLGMKLWIYDENSYPSGFAGGFVPEAMPESRGQGLVFREEKTRPAWSDEILRVYRREGEAVRDVSAEVRSGAAPADGNYIVASIAPARNGPWYGGKFYVDLLRPGVTEKFLSVTLDAYKREIGDEFGRRVPGVFTDEPELRTAGLPWTPRLPELFQQRWGYALTDHLLALSEPVGDWKRVRHDYYQLLLEQFIDRWAKPYYDYCERNGLEFTGHYWEHEWPTCTSVPDNMAMAAWQQRPGIDTLMNQYAEGPRSQFGNVRAVKEVASVANQLGRGRTLSEGYGAGGWDLRFEDMKRIGDWLYVLGVNTLDQHLSYVTLRGARKRDHPQSFSYHEPWWSAYHASADYFARLSVAMTAGQQVNDVLVIEPTTTAWMHNVGRVTRPDDKTPPENPAALEALGNAFQGLVVALERAQVEYDLGSEDIMARHGSVDGAALRVGRRAYRTVVVPPLTENLNPTTVALLERFLAAGGTVVAAAVPDRVDGAPSTRVAAMAGQAGWKSVAAGDVPAALVARREPAFAITRSQGDRGILFHHRRQVDGDQLVLLVNTSIEARSSGTIETTARAAERWDPATGRVEAYPIESASSGSRLSFDLPEAGSLLLRLSPVKQARPAGPVRERLVVVAPDAAPAVKRTAPNVLVLDYVDARAGGERLEKSYVYQASQFGFQKNGLERNPWDSAVQFRDELISRAFPPSSGIEATYRFTVADRVPVGLSLVVERPDLYTVTCNGQLVSAAKGAWWLDRAFGRIDLSKAARVGENQVVLTASPFTIRHEIESAYLLGNFAADAAPSGFVVAPERPLALGAWNTQGHPFYSEGVAYTEKFRVAKPAGAYRVQLKRWYGSVAKVRVNGRDAGQIFSAPWVLDVTPFVRPGSNAIEVTVVGTLKNTLGPHHEKPVLGTAWPAMFQKAPNPGPPAGADYATVGYGLFEPFALVQVLR